MTDQANSASTWHQVNLWPDSWQAAEQAAASCLGPGLETAEDAGLITSWWFVRKTPAWRLRYLPVPGQDRQAAALLVQVAGDLTAQGAIRRWSAAIYEPETRALGGPAAISLAHDLFHADSRHLLGYLRQARHDHRRELALLLSCQLMRAAGQDWYEQGDIWARVAAHRRAAPRQPGPVPAAVRVLITAAADAEHSPLRASPAWPGAFRHAGHQMALLARHGNLSRGLRAVLAHHILFAWNRAGIPAPEQALLAGTAEEVIFGEEPARAFPARPAEADAAPELGSAR